jgi:heparan-sulfate lyase
MTEKKVMALDLRACLFEKMNLDYPGLEKVKKYYLDGYWDKAEVEYLEFRRKLVEEKKIVHPYFGMFIGDSYGDKFEIKYKHPRDYAKFLKEIEFDPLRHKKEVMIRADKNYEKTKKEGGWGEYRFGHARAYILANRFTGDDKYIKRGVIELRTLLNSTFLKRGDKPLDILIPGIWAGRFLPDAYFGFLNHKAMTPAEHMMIVKGYVRLADVLFCEGILPKLNHVQNMFATSSFGLFKASVIFPEFRNSPRWREQSLKWIKEIAKNHILDDGAWEEVSERYSYVIFVDFSKFMELCRVNKIRIDPIIKKRYVLFAEFMKKIMLPNSELSYFGDSEFTHHINSIRRFFELACLEKGSNKAFKIQTDSTHFPDARMVIMRGGKGDNQKFMLFDYGPQWSHTYKDCLAFTLFAYNEYLIPYARKFTSRLLVNGVGIGESRKGKISLKKDIDYVLASKQLYTREPEPALGYSDNKDRTYRILRDRKTGKIRRMDMPMATKETYGRHTRELIFIKPYYWILVDRLIGMPENANIDQLFRLNPDHSAEVKDRVIVSRGKTANLVIAHINGPIPDITLKKIKKGKRVKAASVANFGYKHKEGEFVSTLLLCPFPNDWTPEIQKDSSTKKIIVNAGEFKDIITLRYLKGKTLVDFKRKNFNTSGKILLPGRMKNEYSLRYQTY